MQSSPSTPHGVPPLTLKELVNEGNYTPEGTSPSTTAPKKVPTPRRRKSRSKSLPRSLQGSPGLQDGGDVVVMGSDVPNFQTNLNENFPFALGDKVWALWNEDQKWYPANIVALTGPGAMYQVVFEEYGNQQLCSYNMLSLRTEGLPHHGHPPEELSGKDDASKFQQVDSEFVGASAQPESSAPQDALIVIAPSTTTPVRKRKTKGGGKRHSLMTAAVASPTIDRESEARRWDDVVKIREKTGIKSPLNISVNPLRFKDPAQVAKLTGSQPVFNVDLPDVFAATPVRKYQRQALNRTTRMLSFQLESGLQVGTSVEVRDSGRVVAVTPAAAHPTPQPGEAIAIASSKKGGKTKRKKGAKTGATLVFDVSSESLWQKGVEIVDNEPAPRWGSVEGLIAWTMAKGEPKDKLVLALTYHHFVKATPFLNLVKQLFQSDSSAEKKMRAGVLVFLEMWTQVLVFHRAHEHEDALLEGLCEFVGRMAVEYDKMIAQRNTQAHRYAGSKQILVRLQEVRQQIARDFTRISNEADKIYYSGGSGSAGSMRPDAENVALLNARLHWVGGIASLSAPESLVSPRDALAFIPVHLSGSANSNSNTLQLLKLDYKKVAYAMSHMDAALFSTITGYDLIKGPRSGPSVIPNRRLNNRCVIRINNLVNISAHWNTLSRWPPTCILQEPELKMRAKLIKFFIRVALELKALRNWSSFFAIMIGLGSGTVTTLKDTWKAVPTKYTTLFAELEESCQPMGNFQRYRTAIKESMDEQKYIIPYMAILLKDFQAIEEGNPTKDHRGWINNQKLQLFASVLQKVRKMQSADCPFHAADRRYVTMVAQIAPISENDLWDLSKVVKQNEVAAVMALQTAKTPRWMSSSHE